MAASPTRSEESQSAKRRPPPSGSRTWEPQTSRYRGIARSDTDNYSFVVDPDLPLTLTPGSHEELDLVFAPGAEADYPATLSIVSNSPESEFTVNIEGRCPGTTYSLAVDVEGKDTNFVYVCWLEDASGDTIQHVFVCTRAGLPDTTGLLKTGLPIWSRTPGGAWEEHQDDIDAVTSATVRDDFSLQAELVDPSVRQFRVLFEIDRSTKANAYFNDRPSFLYRSDLIDLDDLQPSYSFELVGWMINDTLSGTYSQAPLDLDEFPFFDEVDDAVFNYRTELEYIENTGGGYDDMIDQITATVTEG
ncbi:MAG: hypothetical protein ACOCZB_08600 [Spirochaetota bacterium]